MGYPMAGHLASNGHDVTVFNRTTAKSEAWCETYAGRSASTPGEAASDAEMVFACVGNDADVRQVMFGDDGIMQAVGSGAIVVDHTTASATIARELADVAAAKSVGFLDAPVSGGQVGAESGQLSVMVGGAVDVFEKAKPVIDCYAKAVTHIGAAGSGQLAKMVNQICIAGIVQGLSEGLHFAKRAGLDVPLVIDAIANGAAQSWQMENRWQTMVGDEFDFGFAVGWMRKDLNIALREAQQNGATLELTKMVEQFYAEIQESGGDRWDTSSLIARLE
jgi:3-hydroxyisobutyrate dehydrogenase-like beta-hydroxyacid dehydrogenase